ncbi:MAG: hypothetical protein HQM13_04930 [SAR324 cluster bacterium]|nr:hypothetical protein [SAR324 cluster bacterium]
MERDAVMEHTPFPAMFPEIRDEALFVQFTEQLFDSGFLFDDAKETEIKQGERLIREFYGQANDVIMHYLSQIHLEHFIHYLEVHQWKKKELREKIRAKILNTFEQLSYGSHHSFNVRRNIRLELLKLHHQTFHEFLLYITAYYHLCLHGKIAGFEEVQSSDTAPLPEPKATVSSQKPLIPEAFPDDESLEELGSLNDSAKEEDEADVVYGEGEITHKACLEFIRNYPDSAIKFLFRLDLDGKALPQSILQIYRNWEMRGMKRGHVRTIILKTMEWERFPVDDTIQELANTLKDQIFTLK